MGVYQTLLAKGTPGSKDLLDFPKTLGGQVMAEATKKKWAAATHMPQILDAFHRALIAFKWRWTPSRSCGDVTKAAQTLDGNVYHAECYVPANAFHQLLIAKSPYGFGVSSTAAKVKTYSGEDSIIGGDPSGGPQLEEGFRRVANINRDISFVATHPFTGIHGLLPNIYDVVGGKVSAFYAWYDHKVVEYQGRYWDPCYNASYLALQGMAKALVIGMNEDRRPTKTIEEAMNRVSEYKLFVMNWHQVAYLRSLAANDPVSESARVAGPFAQSICGDEDTDGSLKALINW